MMASAALEFAREQIGRGGGLWLFLDYDGTLAPFARTPEGSQPDAALGELLAGLAAFPGWRTAIVSGRPLASLQTLLPVPGLILAGTYGLEVRWADGRVAVRVPLEQVRGTVERVGSAWRPLVDGRAGFFLEDKGAAIALHARFAGEADADQVLAAARTAAAGLAPADQFRLLGGHRFLEVAPAQAHKGQSVEWLLREAPVPGARPIYLGDDDKDEEAFEFVREHGGFPIVVGPPRGPTLALERLASPAEARQFLASLRALNRPPAAGQQAAFEVS
jgi:trehalose 6-phosphate phosphatase